MLGSLVFVGGMALEEALDIRAVDDDARLGDELARIGYAGPLPCPTASAPHAYVELHIEQGPILEDEGITIGVVEGVQGISWTELTISGRSAHAGTTPMRLRRDAGYVAAAIAVHARAVGDRARRGAGGDGRPVRGASRPRQRRPQLGDAHRRPAQHRRRRAPPRRGHAGRRGRPARRRRGRDGDDPLAGPLRAGLVRRRDRRPGGGDRAAPRTLARAGCRAAPATTPRCSPASAQRR